jgi:hypothetical protein
MGASPVLTSSAATFTVQLALEKGYEFRISSISFFLLIEVLLLFVSAIVSLLSSVLLC